MTKPDLSSSRNITTIITITTIIITTIIIIGGIITGIIITIIDAAKQAASARPASFSWVATAL
jgi:hypothetical protein